MLRITCRTSEHPLKIAIAANFLVNEIRDSLRLWLETLGISANLVFSPYDTVIQQLLDPAGGFAGVDLAAILLQVEKWCSPRSQVDISSSLQNFEIFLRSLQSAASRLEAPAFVIMSCPLSPAACQNEKITLLEDGLRERLRALPNIDYISRSDLDLYYPVDSNDSYFVDDNLDLEDVAYSPLCFATLATMLARRIYTKFKGPRKVVVVDCDNTLWSGNCGEVGPRGVTIGPGNQGLQETLVRQTARGQLVCLCSKNNESDVLEVFEQHPGMLLRWEHVTARRINWYSKSANLRSLAAELQLGLDAFVFLDDEAFECEAMKQLCPEVLTVQIPNDQAELSRTLLQIWDFDPTPTTKEDEQRVLYYRQNAERERSRSSMLSLEAFLETLDLKVDIRPLDLEDVPRAAQLMQRVNQFNLNGVRRTAAELKDTIPSASCYTVRAADRFGDYGVVGLIMYRVSGEVLKVQSLLLSCRSLGRGVERELGTYMMEKARAAGSRQIEFDYYPTARNNPLRTFLLQLGATLEMEGAAVVAVDQCT